MDKSLSTVEPSAIVRGANWSLALLLIIHLFNYVDRQVLSAVELKIEGELHISKTQMGWAASAFLLSYTLVAPLFGLLAERMSRWMLVGIGVILWSLASGGTGLARTLPMLLITRAFVGVGEAAYGPAAPTIIADLYPIERRGLVLSWFYLAIPLGSALGYVLGGFLEGHFHNWRVPFFAVLPPGILLGIWAFFRRDHRVTNGRHPGSQRRTTWQVCRILLRVPSYVLDTLGLAAMTFAIGGIAFWMPHYIVADRHHSDLEHVNLVFGVVTCVAGLLATLLGGLAGDWLRPKFSGSYFLVSGVAMLVGFPLLLGMLVAPFPWTYVLIFLAVFCLFFNTGPANTILANVTHPSIRATAFAINILVIHLLGDVTSPTLIGWMADHWGMNRAFTVVSLMILVGGVIWLCGARHLQHDMDGVPHQLAEYEQEAVPAYD